MVAELYYLLIECRGGGPGPKECIRLRVWQGTACASKKLATNTWPIAMSLHVNWQPVRRNEFPFGGGGCTSPKHMLIGIVS